MNNPREHSNTAVAEVRRVRDELNREIESATATELVDRVRKHQYASPLLQRLAAKAETRPAAAMPQLQ